MGTIKTFIEKFITGTPKKINKKPKEFKITNKKSNSPQKVLTAEGWRRMMLQKQKAK